MNPVTTLTATRSDVRVFVVEDSVVVRERLVEMIRDVEAVEVVGEADAYDTAVAGILETRPDVAILDINLARGSGIEVLAEVKRSLPGLHGVMLTNYVTPQHIKASADVGAEYFLDKSSEFDRVVEILEELKQAAVSGNKRAA